MAMRRLGLVRDLADELEVEKLRLRVAIASRDGKSMNAHFGVAPRFMVYEVTATRSRFVELVSFDETFDEDGVQQGDPIATRIAALRGCSVVFVLAIGATATAKVLKARIYPVKLEEPESLQRVIRRVQEQLAGTPPPWLRRALADLTKRATVSPDQKDGS